MMFRALVAPVALGCLLSLVGCAAPAHEEAVDQSEDDLSLSSRTFRVQPSGDGCSFPYATLYVKRGGKVTFDNGTWYPNDEEVTGDDNLYFSIAWPSGVATFDVTTGEKTTISVPHLDDAAFAGASSLELDVHCTPLSSGLDAKSVPATAKLRVYR